METIIKSFSEQGTFIQPDTLDYIMSKKNPKRFTSFLKENLKEYPLVLTLEQIKNIEDYFVNHRDELDSKGWQSFCIHGKSYDATREDSYYGDNRHHEFTKEAMRLMPKTVEFFFTEYPAVNFSRVRVMKLLPGGYILLHKDGSRRELSPVNIAITQPDDCHFIVEKYGEIPFKPGKSFFLDVSNMHTVVNYSGVPRYHIIVHADHNDNFKELVVNSYKSLYNKVNEDCNTDS